MPEIEKRLTEGSLTLSSICQVQQVIRHEEKTREVSIEEKRELFSLVENKSQTQVERMLVEARPVAMQAIREQRAHTERPVPGNKHEIRFAVSNEIYAKWEKLKALRSQADFERSPEELMNWLLELGLDKADPERRQERREARRESPTPLVSSAAELRDTIFKRDGYRCAYVSPVTGRRCKSTHALEIDHIHPRALGGTDDPRNLRVLCDAHNRHRQKYSASSAVPYGAIGVLRP